MEQPIRVLIVDGKLICGGVESFIMNIYRHIDRTKVQFDFLVHYQERFFYDDEVEKLGGKIHRLSFRNDGKFFKYKKDLKKFFTEHKEYQIVWGHMDGLASVYLKIAKQCGVKTTIAHSHITSAEKSLKGLIKRLLKGKTWKYADYRFACSTEAGRYLYGKHDFQFIPNAIDTSKFVFNEEKRQEIRKAYGWEDKFVIGHIGRFNEQKNHKFLVEIFDEFLKINPNGALCLCGDGELKDSIKEMVEQRGLTDKVVFTGNIPNVNEYYSAFDCFVMPSLYEGLPVSGIEAQTSGLKCLFADTITKETSLVEENVKFLSIQDTAKVWAKIISVNEKFERVNIEEIITQKDFNINEQSKKLQEFFLCLIDKMEE